MRISIVVPAFNEEKILGATLAQIKSACGAFAPVGWETELIVCDNNSTDRTAAIAQAAGAIVVFEPVNQISRARNTGAARATGDWLVFVDADSRPGTGLFADMIEQIRSGDCLAGGATLQWDRKHLPISWMMPLLNAGFRWRRLLHGAFIFIETATFRQLGGFSIETFSGEDWELSLRLNQRAKESNRRFVILYRHPIVTSGRRFGDYSVLTPFKVLYRTIFVPRRIQISREAARRWYDRRR